MNASDAIGNASVVGSGVCGTYDRGVVLYEWNSSIFLGVLLIDSGLDGRDIAGVEDVFTRFSGGPGSGGAWALLTWSEGADRLRLARFLVLCRFLSNSGRCLKRHYVRS